jgi:hypothetical protein
MTTLLTDAFHLFCVSNPLHPDVFPGLRKMEAEIVQMVLQMHNAPQESGGSVTSGGSESILMAIKAHRDRALELFGITEPEMYFIPIDSVSHLLVHTPHLIKLAIISMLNLFMYQLIQKLVAP